MNLKFLKIRVHYSSKPLQFILIVARKYAFLIVYISINIYEDKVGGADKAGLVQIKFK